MKLKTIFHEYEMPNEFWNRLEKIFEIETKEAFERGKNTSLPEKKIGCGKTWYDEETIEEEKLK